MPLTVKRKLATLLYLLLFTNATSWVFFFAVYPSLRARLPEPMKGPEFWFFAFWFPIVFFGLALFSTRDWGLRIKIFLSGYLSIGLLYNCLWLLLFRAFGHSGKVFEQNLIKDYPVPFFALESSMALQFLIPIFFICLAFIAVYKRSRQSLCLLISIFLFQFLNHILNSMYYNFVLILIFLLWPGTLIKADKEYRVRRTRWTDDFHPMLACFAFVFSVCIFCYATFRWGLLGADISLYGFTYPIVIITFGYAMVGDWHPFRNVFERVKLFVVFWLFEAVFYDWSWWTAYVLFGEPFRWSDPFYVDVLLPNTTMFSFLIVAIISMLIGIYTFFFVRTWRAMIPVFGYFLVLFAMVLHKMLLGKSSWTFAISVYCAAVVFCFVADRIHVSRKTGTGNAGL